MLINKLRSNRYAQFRKKLEKDSSFGLLDLRLKSINSLATQLKLKTKKEKSLLTEIKAYTEFENLYNLDNVVKQLLIEKAGVYSLSEFISTPPEKIYDLLVKLKHTDLIKTPKNKGVSYIRAVQKEAVELKSGKRLDKEIPGIGKKSAEAFAKTGIWSAADLASVKVSDIYNRSSIKKAGITKEKLKSFKLKANMYAGTFVPAYFIDILGDMGIKTQLTLANTNPEILSDKIKTLYNKAKSPEQKSFNISLQELQRRLIYFFKQESGLTSAYIPITEYLKQLGSEPLSSKSALQLIDNAAKLWVGSAIGNISIIDYLGKSTICDCDWEDSIFSEKAYLAYLINAFAYFPADLEQLLSEVEYIYTDCGKRTTLREAILRIQEDLRKDIDQNLLGKDFFDPQKRFLDYEEWLAYMLDIWFPENKFGRLFANTKFSKLFTETNESYIERYKGIAQFYAHLRNYLLSIEIHTKIKTSEHTYRDIYKSTDGLNNPQADITNDIKLRQTHDPDKQKYLKGSLSDDNSVFLDVAKTIKHLLNLYNNISGAAYEGYSCGNWTNAKDLLDGSLGTVNTDTDTPISPVTQLLENIESSMDGVMDIELAKTISLGSAGTMNKIFSDIRNQRGAYEYYRSLMNSIRIDSNYTENIRNIVQSMLVLGSSDPAPNPDPYYSSTEAPLANRLYYMLSNNYTLPLTDDISKIYQKSEDSYSPYFEDSGIDVKDYEEDFPNTSVYSLLNNYSDEFQAIFTNPDNFLNSAEKIRENLEIKIEYNGRMNWDHLAQLFFNLLYHLPYIKYFLVPLLHAEYEKSEGHYDNAVTWLSLIIDFTSSPMEIITPFDLISSEEKAVKMLLANIWLDNAETLFRRNNFESVQHAKELYQKVLALFPDYACFCNQTQASLSLKERILSIFKSDLTLEVKHRFFILLSSSKANVLMHKDIRTEIIKLTKKKDEALEKATNEFIRKYSKRLLPDVSFKKHLNKTKSLFTRVEAIEAEAIITISESVLPILLPEISNIIPGIISKQPTYLMSDIGGMTVIPDIPDLGNFLPNDKETPFEYDFCEYPNPKIIAIYKTACKYYNYIISCRNFIGYRDDDISIYTYRELLKKSRHYIQLALGLEKDYLNWQEALENEELERIKGLQSVLTDKAQMSLGELQIDEANSQALISHLQLEKANDIKIAYAKELEYKKSPLGALGKVMEIGSSAISKGVSMGAINPYLGVAVGVVDTVVGFANWDQEMKKMEAQLKTLDYDTKIASENVNLSQIRIDIAKMQQSINQIGLMMDSMYLQLLYSEVLGPEAYRYMAERARQLFKVYMDMAIRMAWLAERQLEFLRGVELNTIRFDYMHTRQHSRDEGILLAAESLQKDIEELNYQRELTEKNRIKVSKTFSLRNEFPLLFANLQNTGEIYFNTSADYLNLEVIDNSADGIVDKLVYKGHTQIPDHYGYLQQRIESVELRLIGMLAPDQDLKLVLSNMGSSVVMIEEKAGNEFIYTPVMLKRPFQTITFSRAYGENTANTYAFNAPEGILKPFETTGLDTLWQLKLDKISNMLDLQEVFDIQLIINYTAVYSNNYETAQKELIPDELFRTRIFSFRDGDFSDALYEFHNPVQAFPGFRDLRIINFETSSGQFGPNEQNQEIEKLYFYLHAEDKLPFMVWKAGIDKPGLNNNKYNPIKSNFQNSFEDPNAAGTFIETNGLLDYSHGTSGLPVLHSIAGLFLNNKDVNRKWSIKIVPENIQQEYWDKDITGVFLNTRGTSVNSQVPEVLHAKGSATKGKTINLKIPDNILPSWDNYAVQLKFKLEEGGFSVYWRMFEDKGILLKVRCIDSATAEVNIRPYKKGTPTLMPVVTGEWPNPFRFTLDKEDWYLLDCISYINNTNPDKTMVKLCIDKQLVWKGEITINTGKHYGGVNLAIDKNSEAMFDDLWIRRIDNAGNPTGTLFVDTFDGTQTHAWSGLSRSDLTEPFIILKPDVNPAINLVAIENIVLITDYKYQVR